MLCDGNLFCQPRPPEYYVGEVWRNGNYVFVITDIEDKKIWVCRIEGAWTHTETVSPSFMFRCEKVGELAEVKGRYS